MAEAADGEHGVEDEAAGLCEDRSHGKVLDARSRKPDGTLRTSSRGTPCLAAQCFLLVAAMGGAFLLGRTTSIPGLVKVAPGWAREAADVLGKAGEAGAPPAAPASEVGRASAVSSPISLKAPAGEVGKASAAASPASPKLPAAALGNAVEAAAPASPTASESAATITESRAPPRLRLIVNSFVKYAKPVAFLLESLEKANFTDHFRDVVVTFGGSTANIGPHAAPGRWGELGVTFVNSTLNAFDTTGLSSLFHYVDHPRVKADAYLYIHDTVLADAKAFMPSFEKLASIIGEDELRIPQTPNSNMFALGHKVVRSFGTNFDVNLTKGEAVDMEWGRGPVLKKMKHIKAFAKKITNLPGRLPRGMGDPYHTGVPRTKYWYPDFGVTKFILMHKYGDIGGGGLKDNYR